MTEAPATYATEIIQRHVLSPMTAEQVTAWKLRMANAYWELSGLPAFQAVLEDWILGKLLTPCTTEHEEGQRRFVLEILTKLREAREWQEQRFRTERQGEQRGLGEGQR